MRPYELPDEYWDTDTQAIVELAQGNSELKALLTEAITIYDTLIPGYKKRFFSDIFQDTKNRSKVLPRPKHPTVTGNLGGFVPGPSFYRGIRTLEENLRGENGSHHVNCGEFRKSLFFLTQQAALPQNKDVSQHILDFVDCMRKIRKVLDQL